MNFTPFVSSCRCSQYFRFTSLSYLIRRYLLKLHFLDKVILRIQNVSRKMYDSEALESVSESLNYSKIIPSYGNLVFVHFQQVFENKRGFVDFLFKKACFFGFFVAGSLKYIPSGIGILCQRLYLKLCTQKSMEKSVCTAFL